jgi:hypothetical protein
MAKHKKLRAKTTSSGSMRSVSKSTIQLTKDQVPEVVKVIQKLDAWKAGKNPWLTLYNNSGGASSMDKSRLYTKIKANDYLGDPRYAKANVFGKLES